MTVVVAMKSGEDASDNGQGSDCEIDSDNDGDNNGGNGNDNASDGGSDN